MIFIYLFCIKKLHFFTKTIFEYLPSYYRIRFSNVQMFKFNITSYSCGLFQQNFVIPFWSFFPKKYFFSNLKLDFYYCWKFLNKRGFNYWKKLSFCHKLKNFLIFISLQPVGVNLWYLKLRLFDLIELIVWNI